MNFAPLRRGIYFSHSGWPHLSRVARSAEIPAHKLARDLESGSVPLLNCGSALDIGIFLISTTRSTCGPIRSSTNVSRLRLEWPMVKSGSFTCRLHA